MNASPYHQPLGILIDLAPVNKLSDFFIVNQPPMFCVFRRQILLIIPYQNPRLT